MGVCQRLSKLEGAWRLPVWGFLSPVHRVPEHLFRWGRTNIAPTSFKHIVPNLEMARKLLEGFVCAVKWKDCRRQGLETGWWWPGMGSFSIKTPKSEIRKCAIQAWGCKLKRFCSLTSSLWKSKACSFSCFYRTNVVFPNMCILRQSKQTCQRA